MAVLQLLVGVILFALASYIFWRIGDEKLITPRWRQSLGLESLIVLVVLGGWAGGASFAIQSMISMFAN